jgi:predicted dehydrogenase
MRGALFSEQGEFMKKKEASRRTVIKQTALAAGLPVIVPASVLGLNGKVPPSNKIVLGGIGIGGRGRKVLTGFLKQPDCQFVATADPQKERREILVRLSRHYDNMECKPYDNMGDLLARDDIDAVIIATGDRWHTTASIYATRAGKDIYCEKPCAMNMQECRELDEEILKHKRVFQAGTQRRSVSNFQLAVELAHSGRLGTLKKVHAGILQLQDYLDPLPAEPEPEPSVINWDRWVGPAPMKPFNSEYCKKSRWRNHSGFYAAYRLPEWGSHTIDLCQWAAKADGTTPIEFESEGTTIRAKYTNGIELVMRLSGFKNEGDWIEGIGSCPVRFEGDEGWVEAGDFERIEASDPKILAGKTFEPVAGIDPIHHARNFLDCVKTREKPVCNSTVARYGHLACFAAALSWKLGRKLTFDPVTETFPNDAEANGMLGYTRRKPYVI